MPLTVRVDNGSPWGSWSDLPPVLALWLVGMGINVHWNEPNRPQQNGVIERSQGLAKAWAEPGQCHSIRQFQNRIKREDRLQREEYPAIGKKLSRIKAFPELEHSKRRYSTSWEQAHWKLDRVLNHLSTYAVPRKVDSCGKIGVYGRKLYVGILNKGRQVMVQLDPNTTEWLITDLNGQQLRALLATEITAKNVRGLKLKPEWRP